MSTRMPAWIQALPDQDEAPAWIRSAGRTRGTGGHQPTRAERRKAYALFAGLRASAQPGRPGVFAAMRDPDGMTPLERHIFGGGR